MSSGAALQHEHLTPAWGWPYRAGASGAAERERLLAETVEGEESRQRSVAEICREQKAVFVIHSREAKEALEGLSGEGVRLARVIPAADASRRGAGLEGSWLIFE